MTIPTVSSSEFRRNMPSIIDKAEEAGTSVVVFKNSRPWFEIKPLSNASNVPTEETLQAFRDLEGMREDPDAPVYRDAAQFFADLGV